MKEQLLDKLNSAKDELKKKKKTQINTQSPFSILTDEEIALVLAKRARDIRVRKKRTQAELSNDSH